MGRVKTWDMSFCRIFLLLIKLKTRLYFIVVWRNCSFNTYRSKVGNLCCKCLLFCNYLFFFFFFWQLFCNFNFLQILHCQFPRFLQFCQKNWFGYESPNRFYLISVWRFTLFWFGCNLTALLQNYFFNLFGNSFFSRLRFCYFFFFVILQIFCLFANCFLLKLVNLLCIVWFNLRWKRNKFVRFLGSDYYNGKSNILSDLALL